jgi:predicted dehydrogenase
VREAPEEIGVGIIGCGLVTQMMHLPHLLDDSIARVRWLCDRDPARLGLAAARAPSAKACAEPVEVLESDVDAILIATHDLNHPSLALDALAAGKHVFIEKPLALCAADAEAITRRARASGLNVAVGYQRTHDPALPRLAELLGGLGRIGLVHMHDVCHDNDLLVGELVGDPLGDESFARGRTDYGEDGIWRDLARKVFGELPEPLLATYRLVHNLACHDLSVLITLLGEPLAVEYADFWPAHYGIIVWRFAKAKCVLEIGQTDRKWFDQQLIVYGSEATLKASWPSPFVTGASTTIELHGMRGMAEEEVTERLSHRSSFRVELRDFLGRIESGRFDDLSVAHAATVTSWLERALLWHANRQPAITAASPLR